MAVGQTQTSWKIQGVDSEAVLFVETKAERRIDILDLLKREKEWMEEAGGFGFEDGSSRRENGLPPLGVTDVLEAFMKNSGVKEIIIPSAEDVVAQALGEETVSVFTGSVTPTKAQRNLVDWRSGNQRVLAATMAKGGAGLSLHDKVGDHPTTQINLNLPWSASQVVQVSLRSARYGLRGMAKVQWLFCDNIPFDRSLGARVGAKMADMGAMVHGQQAPCAKRIEDWDFEDKPFSEMATEQMEGLNGEKSAV